MGFLLFAARKLQLKREINNKNYELTVLTSQYNQAQKRVAAFQEQMENAKNMTSIFAQAMQANANRSAYTQYLSTCTDASFKEKLQNFLNGDSNPGFTTEESQTVTRISQQGAQAGSALATAYTTVTDSIFDAANKVQLAKLQAEENRLELRKGSLESELSLLQGEYDAVKGQEKDAIKDAVPQFGLA